MGDAFNRRCNAFQAVGIDGMIKVSGALAVFHFDEGDDAVAPANEIYLSARSFTR